MLCPNYLITAFDYIEHCFLSNSSDFYNFLSSDSKLQALGKADAKGIVNALGLQEARVTLDRLAAANRNAKFERRLYQRPYCLSLHP